MESVAIELKKFGLTDNQLIKNVAQQNVVNKFRDMMMNTNSHDVTPEIRARFRYMRDRIRDLEDKNLSCYCSLDSPCHADVLLDLANPPF